MIDLVVSQVPGADKSVVVPNGMCMGAAAILDHLAPGAGARLELWHGSQRLNDAERPRAPVARVVVTRALVGGKGGFGQLLRNLGRAGGGVRTGAEIKTNHVQLINKPHRNGRATSARAATCRAGGCAT